MSAGPADPVASLFTRHGLAPSSTRARCLAFAAAHSPDGARDLREAPSQGRCSYTLFAGDHAVVQFRPHAHRLDPVLACLAHATYPDLAPATHPLGAVRLPAPAGGLLHAYRMARLPGAPLAAAAAAAAGRAPLVRDFARFLVAGWRAAGPAGPTGRVGRTLRVRLAALAARLPRRRLRGVAAAAGRRADAVLALPWVLTHGDVVAGNVLVDGDTGRLRGLLDWAEAEVLPFGVGLVGAEELLGEEREGRGFVYAADAPALRRVLWAELEAGIPELGAPGPLREAVEWARVVGVLLWHGIAWDDGRLDRVVEPGKDEEEIQRLDAFLFGSGTGPGGAPCL